MFMKRHISWKSLSYGCNVTFALPIAPEREGPGDEILWDELSCGAANEK